MDDRPGSDDFRGTDRAMSEQAQEEIRLDERQVAAYLQQNPDFFIRHEPLLANLNLPHASGDVVSLVERQVAVLRHQIREQQQQMQRLAQNARINDELLARLQRMILRLIASRSLDEAIDSVDQLLRDEFHADAVSLHLLDGPISRPEAITANDSSLRPFSTLLQRREPVCGQLEPSQLDFLFGSRSGEIASAVLIPLCPSRDKHCLGMLGIGSIDPQRYHPKMGTTFVAHLGAAISAVLHGHLEE